jgi:hypothetical protein
MMPMLSEKEITVIFANIEDILLTNTVSRRLPLMVFIRIIAGVLKHPGRATKRVPIVY